MMEGKGGRGAPDCDARARARSVGRYRLSAVHARYVTDPEMCQRAQRVLKRLRLLEKAIDSALP